MYCVFIFFLALCYVLAFCFVLCCSSFVFVCIVLCCGTCLFRVSCVVLCLFVVYSLLSLCLVFVD